MQERLSLLKRKWSWYFFMTIFKDLFRPKSIYDLNKCAVESIYVISSSKSHLVLQDH